MPGEEAIFIKGGVIEQTFDSGNYQLSTENYPVRLCPTFQTAGFLSVPRITSCTAQGSG